MKIVDEIVDGLNNGADPKEIYKEYNWSDFSAKDRESLFKIAEESRSDPISKALVHTLLRLAWNNDDWDFVRCGALLIQRDDTNLSEKNEALDFMKKALERIRVSLSNDSYVIDRFHNYLADFKILTAKVQEDNGNLDLALQNYNEAMDSYKKVGASDKILEVERQIAKIYDWQEDRTDLIPISALEDERSRLNQEIEDLNNRKNQITELLKNSRAEVNSLNEQKQALEEEFETRNQEAIDIKAQIDELNGEINRKEKRTQELETSLNFLITLPRLATGPLWVEVVRQALDQGEIDDLTIQALERLSINGSKEAKRLLSETSARLPKGMVLDHVQFEVELNQWFSGVAKAKSLLDEDPFLAAQTMTDAWESFMHYIESKSTNG